jgi:hypothetical protein
VKSIGPLSRYDDGHPDYLKRLRASFKAGMPLIEELRNLSESLVEEEKIRVEFAVKSKKSYSAPKNCGYFILDSLYDVLGIYDILSLHKSRKKIDLAINNNTKLLIFGRTLNPDSKYQTHAERDRYVFDVSESKKVQDVYDTLTELDKTSESIQKRMNLKIGQTIGRNTEVCYYDVTNYYFEIGENDADVYTLDKEGKLIIGADGKPLIQEPGLRKKGVSKERRNTPIAMPPPACLSADRSGRQVQMGLFTDDNGIPISYQLFPGNNTDTTTLRPAMKKTIDNMNFGRIIIVADGGLNSGKNIAHILDGGNGYIVSKSTKKSAATVKTWILAEAGYTWNKERTFKVK